MFTIVRPDQRAERSTEQRRKRHRNPSSALAKGFAQPWKALIRSNARKRHRHRLEQLDRA
jgi:hypothetical protein